VLLSAKHSSGTVGGLAYAFINFLYDPAVAAENTTFLKYLCPNRDAYGLLPEDLRKNPGVFISPFARTVEEKPVPRIASEQEKRFVSMNTSSDRRQTSAPILL
jgi:spermidine/putrescine-binding protein